MDSCAHLVRDIRHVHGHRAGRINLDLGGHGGNDRVRPHPAPAGPRRGPAARQGSIQCAVTEQALPLRVWEEIQTLLRKRLPLESPEWGCSVTWAVAALCRLRVLPRLGSEYPRCDGNLLRERDIPSRIGPGSLSDRSFTSPVVGPLHSHRRRPAPYDGKRCVSKQAPSDASSHNS